MQSKALFGNSNEIASSLINFGDLGNSFVMPPSDNNQLPIGIGSKTPL